MDMFLFVFVYMLLTKVQFRSEAKAISPTNFVYKTSGEDGLSFRSKLDFCLSINKHKQNHVHVLYSQNQEQGIKKVIILQTQGGYAPIRAKW